jgi:hypothetical protein
VYKAIPGFAHSAAKGRRHRDDPPNGTGRRPAQHSRESLSPGLIEVPATSEFLKQDWFRQPMVDKLMLPRWGQPEDVAGAAVFLASDDSSWITGIDLLVDGGTTAW